LGFSYRYRDEIHGAATALLNGPSAPVPSVLCPECKPGSRFYSDLQEFESVGGTYEKIEEASVGIIDGQFINVGKVEQVTQLIDSLEIEMELLANLTDLPPPRSDEEKRCLEKVSHHVLGVLRPEISDEIDVTKETSDSRRLFRKRLEVIQTQAELLQRIRTLDLPNLSQVREKVGELLERSKQAIDNYVDIARDARWNGQIEDSMLNEIEIECSSLKNRIEEIKSH